MESKKLENILILRLIVSSLAEKKDWWPSDFSENGAAFLGYVLPRSKFKATIKSLNDVAKYAHDQMVGVGKFHLFRFNEYIEEEIFQLLEDEEQNEKLLDKLKGNELNLLEEFSQYLDVDASSGPVLSGTKSEISSGDIFPVLASHYFKAFKSDYKTYPYLN